VTYNLVQVTLQITDPTGNPATPQEFPAAGLLFQVSDFVWDTTAETLVVVPPVEVNTATYTSATIQVSLLAMDNPTLSQNWAWIVAPVVPGVQLPARKLTVDYANGAQQNFAALLQASLLVT
jgi:hypothetical protein